MNKNVLLVTFIQLTIVTICRETYNRSNAFANLRNNFKIGARAYTEYTLTKDCS